MFVPAGRVSTIDQQATAARVTPNITGGTRAASVPVTYSRPNANARPLLLTLITPRASVSTPI